MSYHKFVGTVKRAIAGILIVGMTVQGMPVFAVEAANQIPGQETNIPGDSGEEASGETKPGGSENSEETKPGGSENSEETKPGSSEGSGETKPGGFEGSGETKPGGSEGSGETKPGGSEGSGEIQPGDNEDPVGGQPDEGDEDTNDERTPQDGQDTGDDMNAVSGVQISGNDISGNDLAAGEKEGDYHADGYIEMPEDRDVSVVNESARIYDYESDIAPLMSDSLPAKYVPEKGKLPLTRNQNPYGSCWAFTSMALAEIDMRKNDGAFADADYSELHLAYFSYNGAVNDPLGGLDGDANSNNDSTKNFMQQGGNLTLAQYVLANWVGAADEKTAPYSQAQEALENGLSKDLAFEDVAHLQNALQVNLQENPNIAKRMILRYGGLGTSYYNDMSLYYKEDDKSYYCDTAKKVSHAVTIVGWDDSFRADQFKTTPEGDGAWLIRNSWSAGQDVDSIGKDTYFWMSYYDKSLAAGYAFDFEGAESYHHNYQYDGSMYTGAVILPGNAGYAANVFTAKAYEGGEKLEAVGLTFYKAQTPYTISVYKNLQSADNPESGTLVEEASVSGTCICEGFYTIPLASPVRLAKGETFSVVVRYGQAEEDEKVYLPREYPANSWFRCVTAAKEGQSFYRSESSTKWTDYGKEKNANFRIKAYTMNDDGGMGYPAEIKLAEELEEGLGLGVGDSYQASCTVLPRSASDRGVRWESSNAAVAKVDEKGLITGISDGKAEITVTCTAHAEGSEPVKAVFFVEVYSALKSIRITGVSRVTAGSTAAYRTVRSPSSVDAAEVEWSSSDERVVTVAPDGVVTGVSPGYVSITAKIGAVTDTKKITCEFPGITYKVTSSISGLRIIWPGNPGAASYRLYRAEGKSWTNPTLLTTITPDNSASYDYLDQDVIANHYYTYRVEATVNYIKGDGYEEKTVASNAGVYQMPEYYAITYHLNGGENDGGNPATYRVGTPKDIKDPRERSGYHFDGWYFDENLTQKLEGKTLPSDLRGDIDLYAGWTPIVYQITYKLNGGINAAGQRTSYTIETDTFTFEEPTRAGYGFDGWYTDAAFTAPIETVTRGSTGDLTLYAKCYEDCRVTFDVQGHGTAPETIRNITVGSTIDQPDDPVAEGYTFKGWCRDAACTQDWKFDTDIVQSDLTLYAKWLKKSAIESSQFQLQEIRDVYSYTGSALKPAVNVYDGNTLLKAGRDYTVKYVNNINANAGGVWKKGSGMGADFNPGIPYVQITGRGNYTDEIKVNFDIHPAAIGDGEGNPAKKVVLRYTDQFAAADRELKPFGSIRYTRAMKLSQDYTLQLTAKNVRDSSGSAVQPGQALAGAVVPKGYEGEFTLTVTGTGNYTGEISRDVYVTDKQHLMKNVRITLGRNQKRIELVGEKVELQPSTEDSADTFTVKMGRTTLTPGQDYMVGYQDESNKKVGKATLVITGAGDYIGAKTISFNITGKPFTAAKIKVTGVEEKVYTGKAVTQNDAVLVYNSGKPDERQLIYGADYTVSYARNINKGTATMTFTGSKEAGFSGSFRKTFRILAAPIDNTDVVKRTGSWNAIVEPYSKAGAKPDIELENANGIPLQKGKDYTLSYKNNRLVAGAAAQKAPTVTVRGRGNYQGSFSVPFSIDSADLSDMIGWGEITVKITPVAYQPNRPGDYVYKPAVKLLEGKTALRAGVDYTVTYKNNTQAEYEAYIQGADAGNDAPALAPQVVIGAGSANTYRIGEEPDPVPLTIYRHKLTKGNLLVEITDTSQCVYAGTQVTPEVKVSYLGENGTTELVKGKDYTVSYGTNVKSGRNAGKITISGTGTLYGGDVTVSFEISKKKIIY